MPSSIEVIKERKKQAIFIVTSNYPSFSVNSCVITQCEKYKLETAVEQVLGNKKQECRIIKNYLRPCELLH